jgi:hypothetical protein
MSTTTRLLSELFGVAAYPMLPDKKVMNKACVMHLKKLMIKQ